MLSMSASFRSKIRNAYLFDETVEFKPGNLLVQAPVAVAPTEGSNGDADAVVEPAEEIGNDETAVTAIPEDSDVYEDSVAASLLEIGDTVR